MRGNRKTVSKTLSVRPDLKMPVMPGLVLMAAALSDPSSGKMPVRLR